MMSLEMYAEICAEAAAAGGDPCTELEIAAARGYAGPAWTEAKAHFIRRMSDPADGGSTALAFMPLYQAALRRAHSR